jgi:phosphoglycerate dehydrogenase-like enzyme
MLIGYHGQFDPLLFAEIEPALGGIRLVPYADIQTQGRIGEMQALITRSGLQLDAGFFARALALRIVVKAGSGTDNIDEAVARDHGIVVKATGGAERSVAELAIALMFATYRQMTLHNSAMRDGRWDSKRHNVGRNISRKVLGVIGFGRIGLETAALARCLGMSVRVWDRSIDKPEKARAIEAMQAQPVSDIHVILTQSDIVSLHLPWCRGMVPILGPSEIAAMRPGAVLINTARAQLVDRGALFAALKMGRITAGLDVHYDEGGQDDRDLIALPNVVALPHIGAQTEETQANIARLAVQIITEHFATERIQDETRGL